MPTIISVSPELRLEAEHRLETTFTPAAQFIGRLRPDHSVWGVVVFDRFSTYDCQMHFAGDKGWVNRELIRCAFAYPFRQLGLARVTGMVDATNQRVIAMDQKMGFRIEGCMRNALGDRDVIVMGMTKEECRYLSDG